MWHSVNIKYPMKRKWNAKNVKAYCQKIANCKMMWNVSLQLELNLLMVLIKHLTLLFMQPVSFGLKLVELILENELFFWFNVKNFKNWNIIFMFIHSIGYHHLHRFLSQECGVHVDNNFIQPLYKHVLNINHPTMAFICVVSSACYNYVSDLQVSIMKILQVDHLKHFYQRYVQIFIQILFHSQKN